MASDVLIMNIEYMMALEALWGVVKIKMPGRIVHKGAKIAIQTLTIQRKVIGRKSMICSSSVFS
jgi:hypothetical protein